MTWGGVMTDEAPSGAQGCGHKYQMMLAQYIGPCVYTGFMCPGVNQGIKAVLGHCTR